MARGNTILSPDENVTPEVEVKTDENVTPEEKNPPSDPPPKDEKGEIPVFSEERKGKKIIGASGKVIEFDDNGKAKVNKVDAEYLKEFEGFKVG